MQQFSVQSAGFAALTLSDLMLQQLMISGLVTADQARQLLASAIARHSQCAENDAQNASLNIQTAQLIQKLAAGLEPLLKQYDADPQTAEKPTRIISGKLTLLPVAPNKTVAPAKSAPPPPSIPPMGADVFAPAPTPGMRLSET